MEGKGYQKEKGRGKARQEGTEGKRKKEGKLDGKWEGGEGN